MKKILALLLVAVLAFTIITACATSDDSPDSAPTPTPTNTPPPDTPPPTVEPNDPILEENGLEIVDGNFRFIETRKIVASFWDRAHDRQVMSESHWVEWVAEQMLEIHNIEVEWAQFRRWPDGEDMVTRIAANDPLDVAFDFGFDRIQPLADMGAIHDLTPLLAQYGSLLPNMYDLLGIDLIVRNRNPNPPHNMWAIANRQTADTRINTFVREDWLKALDIAPPTTLQEFEDMLFAFRDNAELLLGANAAQMIPYQPSSDLGWTADPVFTSFIPDDISEREWFIFGFDDRRFTMPGVKEGFRVLNNWYNEGLLFNDFALYDDQDPIFDDNLKLGFVGAFSGNWDFPFREDRGIIFGLKEEVGPDANFIVVTPFQNNAGNVVMHMPQATDRQIIIPATALDPLAALMYIDFMSRPTTIAYLSFGVEGINHTRSDDGIYQMIGADDIEDDAMIIVSVRNFDLNLMVGANGVFTGDPALDVRQRASALPGIPRAEVEAAINAQENHKRIMRNVNVGNIEAQGLYGSGLSSIRDEVLALSVTASVADFDSVWDAGMVNYLSSGGKQIIEERDAAWERTFGNVDHMPD